MDPPRTNRPAVSVKRPAPHRRPPRRQGRARRRVRRDTPLQALCRFAGTFVLSLLVLIPLGLAVGADCCPLRRPPAPQHLTHQHRRRPLLPLT